MFTAADFDPDLILASLPERQAGGRPCVCARQESILGGDLSPLPSCCLLATLILLEGNLTLAVDGGVVRFQPVSCHRVANSGMCPRAATWGIESGPCTAGETGHSRDCTCLFREQICPNAASRAEQRATSRHYQADRPWKEDKTC